MKYLNRILILAILAFFFSCNNAESGMEVGAEMANDYYADEMPISVGEKKYATNNEEVEDSQEEATEEVSISERKLIKTGSISFETDDLAKTKKTITQAVKKYKAYISSENEDSYSDRISDNITIRVPSESFDNLLADISKGVENFDSKNISVSDVTSEYLDVTARIKTKKELETRYHELLKQANTVSEILEIEREIANLRADIESFEGRLKYLKNQVSYSTLSVEYYVSSAEGNKFNNKFSDGFGNGWDNFIWFFVLLANIWPYILIIFTIVFFVIRHEKKKRRIVK